MLKFVKTDRTVEEVVRNNSNLSHHLDNLAKGRSDTDRSWWFEHESPEALINKALGIARSCNNTTRFGKLFNQFEEDYLPKLKPQGGLPPLESKEMLETLEPIFEKSEYDDEHVLSQYWQYTKEFASYLFGESNLMRKRRKSFKKVVDDMRERDTLESNSGYPRWTRRNTVKEDEIQDAELDLAYERPAVGIWRNYRGRLRPVWAFPMSQNLKEYQFTQVIQEAMRKSPNSAVRQHLSPWEGYEEVKRTLTKQWKRGYTAVGGDTTKMDAHMRRAQVRLVYEIVKWLFQPQEWDDLYRNIMHICDIELLLGPDKKLIGYHGLASGSGWTQLVETVLVIFILWLRKILVSMGIGDDFEFIALVAVTADEVVDMLQAFGLPANAAKQTVSKVMLEFLQRLNAQGFFSREDPEVLGGYYRISRAVQSLMWPEKMFKKREWRITGTGSDMFCSRCYMIFENLVDDPGFEQFVLWAVRGQADLIPFAKKTASELDRIQAATRKVPGFNPTYNQEKLTKPLSSFASIKLVASRL